MTKPKPKRDKKFDPNNRRYDPTKPKGNTPFYETTFLYSLEDSESLMIQMYHNLELLASPMARYSHRTNLMIRVYAALEMMKWFESEKAEEVLLAALDILNHCRDKVNKCIKKFSDQEYTLLAMALSITQDLFDGCSLWEEALAIKVGEDKMLRGAEDFEYVFAGKPE